MAAVDPGGVPSDAAARQLIAEALDETLVVEAAAGTGKTTELVNRILEVLARGKARVDEIVAVTFTEKAAGELKLRLRQKLEEARRRAGDPEAAARLDAAVQNLEEAHVSTIHGFCADLLRERPVEARVDPLFRVLTEGQAERLFDQAFGAWFQERLERPPEGVRRSLRRTGRAPRFGEADEDGPIERLRRAGLELAEWRDFPAPWTREPFDRAAAIGRVAGLVRDLAGVSQKPSYAGDNLYVDTEPVRRLHRHIAGAGAGRGGDPDLDELESLFIDLRKNRDFKRMRKGSGPTYSKGVARQPVLDARASLVQALDDFALHADADLAALLHVELLDCVARYEELKAREGALDFLDLLLRARDLVRDDRAVREHFQRRFTRIFVDEFQDTDPLQAELLLLLASGDPGETRWQHVTPVPGKLFVVGDPKQSIYRFRRADVSIYRQVCERLTACGATAVELRTSFRAVPNLQRAINAAFRPRMNGDREALQAEYVPLAPAREGHPAQPSVLALPVPRPYAQRYVAAKAIEESLPDAVGAFVEWLVHRSGWTVTERRDPGRRVPLAARHVCLLFRRFVSYGEDVTRPYVEALEARGVRHLLVGGRAFHDRDEIETLRAALMAVEWPDDQLSVFATLRGALFGIGDEELLEYHDLAGGFHPFRIAAGLPSHLDAIADALTLLRELHVRRNRRPVADTISRLLDRTRAHVSFVLRPGGEQVLANVLHVAELARQYELDGGLSFRGFVDALQAVAAGGQAAEAPILEEGSDGVRLMTVHKAKGLEFPVVVLADITARLTPYEAARHVDAGRRLCALRIGGWSPIDLVRQQAMEIVREEKEGERVAYVAATRARDLLVVPAVGDGPYEGGWIAPLNAAVYPDEDVRRAQNAAPGCPPFASRDTVLWRPDGDPATKLTVCPGAHTRSSPEETWSVVWWSPDALQLDVQAPFGLRRDDLIVKDVQPAMLKQQLERYEAWRAGRDAAVARAKVPSVGVVTVTEAALRGTAIEGCDDIEVALETVPGAASRPGGVRFGSLVHATLADVPLDARAGEAAGHLAAAHGRVLGASEEEVAAAREAVGRVLAHPVLRAAMSAARSGRCHREAPVTLSLSDGALLEGYVDLVFDEGDRFVVVDFKTDRELDGALDRYRRQARMYAAAVSAATGKPARAVLMRV